MYVIVCLRFCLCCAAWQHRQSCQQPANERCPPSRPRLSREHGDGRGCRCRWYVIISWTSWEWSIRQESIKQLAFSKVLGVPFVAVEAGVGMWMIWPQLTRPSTWAGARGVQAQRQGFTGAEENRQLHVEVEMQERCRTGEDTTSQVSIEPLIQGRSSWLCPRCCAKYSLTDAERAQEPPNHVQRPSSGLSFSAFRTCFFFGSVRVVCGSDTVEV